MSVQRNSTADTTFSLLLAAERGIANMEMKLGFTEDIIYTNGLCDYRNQGNSNRTICWLDTKNMQGKVE